MATAAEIREARAELQKMQAEMADDRAFGMFSPALQRRITDTKKAIADLTVELGEQKDAERELTRVIKDKEKQLKLVREEEQKSNRLRLAGLAAGIVAYKKLESGMRSLREAGMANTIEANQQNIAYTLLGRELAGVFMPATQATTNVLMSAQKAMSGLTEGGQDVVLVLSYATAGLVTFTAAQVAATAAGLKFTGVLAVMARWLPLIGLAGGAIVALGALFLSSETGASMLNSALEGTVELLNEIGKKTEALKKMSWKDWLGIKAFEIMEGLGMVKGGLADFALGVVADDIAAKGKGKGKERRQPTPGNFQFENSSAAAFERVQIAAAKSSIGGKDTPEKQLEVEQAQLKVLEQLRDGGWVNKQTGMFGSGSDF